MSRMIGRWVLAHVEAGHAIRRGRARERVGLVNRALTKHIQDQSRNNGFGASSGRHFARSAHHRQEVSRNSDFLRDLDDDDISPNPAPLHPDLQSIKRVAYENEVEVASCKQPHGWHVIRA